ncbi:ACP S-malonyltransferase [Paenibacillus kobensis]|uniref:ACP S-malonyltransferase n=1 Tax=Paenibacillus kobensis TaxID=59841 RepID=UPI000FD88D35|nr:ACP S-malonyltransferase [Paenibacillus kobensis]
MVSYVFPGQGSQKQGMGGALFDEYPELTAQADAILGYSIRELCLEESGSRLNQTAFTQPALFVVNAMGYLKRVKDDGITLRYAAGHSLGEYNALFAAGAFDFETGLELVKKRGELMGRAAGGGMAAVIGLTEEEVSSVLRKHGLSSIDMANLNSPKQIVISGPRTDIEAAQALFESEPGVAMYSILKTSGAFHSRYMEGAARQFEDFITAFRFKELQIPVISNVYARPYRHEDMKRNLVEQITRPVRWTESVRYMLGLGEETFAEIGAGNVLTGLIRRIKAEAGPLIITEEEAAPTGAVQVEQVPVQAPIPVPVEHSAITEAAEEITGERPGIVPSTLGSEAFRRDYGLKYAYVQSGMHMGIASADMVVRMGKAGMLGFYGSDGLELERVAQAVEEIRSRLTGRESFGVNIVHRLNRPAQEEERLVDLLLAKGVRIMEASSFLGVTRALAKYRANGLRRSAEGHVVAGNKIIAKVSRPEVAELFLSPVPEPMLTEWVAEGVLTPVQAGLLRQVPLADDLCVECDSAGVTDGGSPYALLPAIVRMRDRMAERFNYACKVRIGAAGGIGTPEAAAASFMLGADFIVTGSINQLTAEANLSESAKDLLQQANVQDFQYAPSGDLFEIGVKAHMLKRGVLYPARANKLYDLYRIYNSLEEIDDKNRRMLQESYFYRSFDQIYGQLKEGLPRVDIEKLERNPKQKMAEIFRWYLKQGASHALQGNQEQVVNYQIRSGPALGAFNQWVKGTELEDWRSRHADEIGLLLMNETARLLNDRIQMLIG